MMRGRRIAARARQSGAALILLTTMLVFGVLWFAIDALAKAARTDYEKEIRTGLALHAAKAALLAHAAQYAARSSTIEPGQMPCPESLNYYLAGTEGQASTSCSNTAEVIGRLPWRTLGIEQLRDGHNEPLWYVLSRGFRNAPVNFGTSGQIHYNGAANAAVALIIAPGPAIDNTADSGTPTAPCIKVNQRATNRNDSTAGPLDPAKFFECGNATGAYGNPGNMPGWAAWSNDRVIAITAQEWADAVAPAVADRLQRQTLPALRNWESAQFSATGKSWASTWARPYLPFAATFGDPTASSFCGTGGVREGLAPVAASSMTTCDTRWTASAAGLLNLLLLGCSQEATYASCAFLGLNAAAGATITATAPNIANGFRGTIAASDIVVTGGGSVTSSAMTLSSSAGSATLTLQVSFPILGLLELVEVRVPYVPDAIVLSDPRVTWVTSNNWQRYLYYAAAPGATVDPSPCAAIGDPGCIQVLGLPAATGAYWRKQLLLALSGAPLAHQSRSCGSDVNSNGIPDCNEVSMYFEDENASANDRQYRADFRVANPAAAPAPYPPFNDRLAVCPFQVTLHSGATSAICD